MCVFLCGLYLLRAYRLRDYYSTVWRVCKGDLAKINHGFIIFTVQLWEVFPVFRGVHGRVAVPGVGGFILPSRCLSGVPAPCRFRLIPTFAEFVCPHPPTPLPRWGRGRLLVCFAGGEAPGTPMSESARHRLSGRFATFRTHAGSGTGSRYLSGYRGRHPFAAKKFPLSTGKGAAKESGGNRGGDGTIRRYATAAPEMVPSPRGGAKISCRGSNCLPAPQTARKAVPPPARI